MADVTLTLGDFTFQESEIPEQIAFGGEQKLAVHKLVGGGRIIDAMGRDDAVLEWSGMLLGQDALTRARYLDGLRVAGAPLDLTWSEFQYRVVIRSFHAPFERFYKIPYTIACEVLEDKSSPVTSLSTPGVVGLVQTDFSEASSLSSQIGDALLTQAMTQFSSTLSSLSPGAKISRSIQRTLLASLQSAQDRVDALITSANTALQAGAQVASAAALTAQATAVQLMGNLQNLNGLLGRIGSNVSAATGGLNIVTVAGGNLFDLAARYYGDPTEWTTIALANGLADPFISIDLQLVIPDIPDASGGVLTA